MDIREAGTLSSDQSVEELRDIPNGIGEIDNSKFWAYVQNHHTGTLVRNSTESDYDHRVRLAEQLRKSIKKERDIVSTAMTELQQERESYLIEIKGIEEYISGDQKTIEFARLQLQGYASVSTMSLHFSV